MKERFSEEFLSAYVDGELPPRERAEVEQWLEDSPEARQRLEDFRRLSMLFASLPRTEISLEFPAQVLQLAERRMLLPETVAVSARRRFHRRILAIGGAIASAAAVLLVIVHFRDPGLPPREHARNADLPLPLGAVRHRPVDEGRRATDQWDGELYAGNDRNTGAQPLAPPAAAFADDQPSPDLARPGTAAPVADSDAINPQIAEFSREMDRLGDADADDEHLSVVTIHIDHADGLMLVQKILVNNNVLPAGIREAQEKAEEKVAIKSRAAASAPAGDLKECLIVIAEPERVIAALSEILEREDSAIRFTVEAPLEIAALDAASQKLLKQSAAEGDPEGGARPRRRDAAAPEAPSADKVEERGEKDKAVGGKGKGGGDALPGADAAKSDGDANADRVASATSDMKKTANVQRGESGKLAPSSLRSDSPDADKGLAKRKEAAASPDHNRTAMGQALQFVVPVPKEIESRQLSATPAKPQASRDSASLEMLANPAPKAAKHARADGKALAESEAAHRSPALVRVLFVIEPGAARPAAPVRSGRAPSEKGPSRKDPDGKGPDGGAS